jgi:hypothetical protein
MLSNQGNRMSKSANPLKIDWELIPYSFVLGDPITIDYRYVRILIAEVDDVIALGLSRNHSYENFTSNLDLLKALALSKEPKQCYSVTAGARREARLWLLEQGSARLDHMKSWFE